MAENRRKKTTARPRTTRVQRREQEYLKAMRAAVEYLAAVRARIQSEYRCRKAPPREEEVTGEELPVRSS